MFTLLAPGCADEDQDPCEHRVCDIADPACIEQVSATVACKLGQTELVIPEVRMLSAAEVVAELEAERETPTDQEIQAITDYFRGESLVGLMPPDYSYSLPQANITNWAVAFYSRDDDSVVIITDNLDADTHGSYLVMVHEMIHVYQDAAWDLDALHEAHARSFDRFMGLRAVLEGEATLYGSLASIELEGYLPFEIDWAAYFEDFQADVLMAANTSEEPSLDAIGQFPYAYGIEFMYQAWWQGDREAIDEVFEQPPDSVRQAMAGYEAWPDQLENGDAELDLHAAPVLPEHYTALGGGHQSLWLLNAMLRRTAGRTEAWSSAILDDISADFLSVYRDEQSGELVAIWRIQTDALALARAGMLGPGSRWAEDPAASPASHLITSVDADLVLVATSGPDAAAVLADIEGWTALDAMASVGAPTRTRAERGVLACADGPRRRSERP